jgi:hypothetical protein
MKTKLAVVMLVVAMGSCLHCFAQKSETSNSLKLGDISPNELPGLEMFRNERLRSIRPGIASRPDVVKAFGSDCAKPCDIDGKWTVWVAYFDTEINKGTIIFKKSEFGRKGFRLPATLNDTVRSVVFAPKKTTSLSAEKFPAEFDRTRTISSAFPDSVAKLYFQDKFGLEYVIFDGFVEKVTKAPYGLNKGDLISISYTVPKEVMSELYTEQVNSFPKAVIK